MSIIDCYCSIVNFALSLGSRSHQLICTNDFAHRNKCNPYKPFNFLLLARIFDITRHWNGSKTHYFPNRKVMKTKTYVLLGSYGLLIAFKKPCFFKKEKVLHRYSGIPHFAIVANNEDVAY